MSEILNVSQAPGKGNDSRTLIYQFPDLLSPDLPFQRFAAPFSFPP